MPDKHKERPKPLRVRHIQTLLENYDPDREVHVRINDSDEAQTYTSQVVQVYIDRGKLIMEGEML